MHTWSFPYHFPPHNSCFLCYLISELYILALLLLPVKNLFIHLVLYAYEKLLILPIL